MRRLGLLVLGLAVGLAAAVLHQSWVWLTITAVAAVAVMVAVRPRERVWWAAGFAALPLLLSWPRGEGDVILAGNASIALACLAALQLGIGLAGLLPEPAGRPT